MTATNVFQMMIPIDEISTIFGDIDPIIQQDDGRVCTIQYPTSFSLAYSYMRAVWQQQEYSERSLRLSGTCVQLNPANYSSWHYRRECLKRLGLAKVTTNVEQDLDLAAALGGPNPKNYQIWYHRRSLLENFGITTDLAESELDYISSVFNEDAKNYHAWSYRQWIVQSIDSSTVWANEMEYASKLIQNDPRNNSVWNHRWFVAHKGSTRQRLSDDVARREADFALDFGCRIDPYNESPMRFLVAILKEQQQDWPNETSQKSSRLGIVADFETKLSFLREVLKEANRNPDGCNTLSAGHVDILEMIGDRESLLKACNLSRDLGTKHDVIRKKYWKTREDRIQSKLGVSG